MADWIEQLIAESSGKDGRGLLPIVGERPGPARRYGPDRLMVYLRREGTLDRRARGWARAGLPVAVIEVGRGASALGAEFFRWEVATAAACHRIGVNAFNQPDVQSAKLRTAALVEEYRKRGRLPRREALWEGSGLSISGARAPDGLREAAGPEAALGEILKTIQPRDALILLLYLPADRRLVARARRLQYKLGAALGAAVSVGIGPRYLHSTGQLHKGGPQGNLYLLITADPQSDVEIPGWDVTFGLLERAQAMGDLEALLAARRRAYAVHLDSPAQFADLTQALLRASEAATGD